MLFLSIDFGTSAVKVSIVGMDGNVLCWSKSDYHYIILPGEKSELSPKDLFTALYDATAKLDPELRQKIDCICYDTFSPSPVFLDKDGELIYPNIITHMDRRSRAQSVDIEKMFGKDAYMNITGIYPFAGGCSAMTYLWFLQNEPWVYDKAYAIGHLAMYIHKKFTGLIVADFVNASMMGTYETTTQKGWSDEIINTLGLRRDLFKEIRNPGELYGSLLPEIAEAMGVRTGIPVAIGTNDVAAAQMGAGNRTAGGVMNATGSSEMVSILVDTPKVNPHYYLRNAALPGLWQIYVTTCGGFGVDWFYDQFCQDMTKEEFYEFEAQAIRNYVENGNGGVTFAPFLTGDRQSLEKKTASWNGLTLAATRGQMIAALLASIQSVMYDAMAEAAKVTQLNDPVKISGGMATEAYMEMKKQAYHGLGLEVVDDCPILGNVELVKYYMK